jgi:hypothetical protein
MKPLRRLLPIRRLFTPHPANGCNSTTRIRPECFQFRPFQDRLPTKIDRVLADPTPVEVAQFLQSQIHLSTAEGESLGRVSP